MKLVQSSTSGAVERDRAIQLLTERAVITRLICQELQDADSTVVSRRPQSALFILLRWIQDHQREPARTETRADDGLNDMIVPEGYEHLMSEIRAGAEVCKALSMLLTADNGLQADHDRMEIRARLCEYWDRYARPVAVIWQPF